MHAATHIHGDLKISNTTVQIVSHLCIKISKIPTEPRIIEYFSEHSSVCRKYIQRNELSSYSTCKAFINSWIGRSGSWEKSRHESSGKRGGRRDPIDAAGTGMRSQGRNFMFAVFFSPGWMENEEAAWSGSRVTVLRPRLVYDCFTACERLARATSPITVKSCHRLR